MLRPLEPRDCVPHREIFCVESSKDGAITKDCTYHILDFYPIERCLGGGISDRIAAGMVAVEEVQSLVAVEIFPGAFLAAPQGFHLWHFRIVEPDETKADTTTRVEEKV